MVLYQHEDHFKHFLLHSTYIIFDNRYHLKRPNWHVVMSHLIFWKDHLAAKRKVFRPRRKVQTREQKGWRPPGIAR